MEARNMFDKLSRKAIARSHFFWHDLIVIKKENFKPFQKYFKSSFNLFNSFPNFRTTQHFRHIHAIEHPNCYELHMDNGNIDTNPVLGYITHGIIDFIPYFIWHLFIWERPYSIAYCNKTGALK